MIRSTPTSWRSADSLARRKLAADVEVPREVLGRCHRHPLGRRPEEVRLGGVAERHPAVEPVERLEATWDPRHPLLGEDDVEGGVPLEDAAEDEMPDGPVGEPRQLDQHDGPGHLGVAVVGDAATAVDVDDHPELLAELPQRLVVRVPQGRQPRAGGQRRQQQRRRRARTPCRPSDLRQGVVDVGWRRSGPRRRAVRGPWRRSRRASGCAPAGLPTAARSRPRSGRGRPGCPPRRTAGRCSGRAPRRRCRRPRSRPGAAPSPSSCTRSAPADRRTG